MAVGFAACFWAMQEGENMLDAKLEFLFSQKILNNWLSFYKRYFKNVSGLDRE